MGAAPNKNISHWSNPKVSFNLLKNNFLAMLQPRGVGWLWIYAKVPSIPILKAH